MHAHKRVFNGFYPKKSDQKKKKKEVRKTKIKINNFENVIKREENRSCGGKNNSGKD